MDGNVVQNKLRARFFGDEGVDFVEISIIGDPNTVIRKVTPEDTRQFERDWENFVSNRVEVDIVGTPLTVIPGLDRNAALGMKLKGVRTLEELAGLDEAAAKSLGMGGLTFWHSARQLVELMELRALKGTMSEPPRRGPGRPPKSVVEATPSVEVVPAE